MRGPSVWIFVAAILAAGCATARLPTPVTMDCQLLRMTPLSSTSERVDFRSWGYSLLPPQGNHWCSGEATSKGTMFHTHPLFGKVIEMRPSDAEIRHTFVFSAVADEVPKDAKMETTADMVAFVETSASWV